MSTLPAPIPVQLIPGTFNVSPATSYVKSASPPNTPPLLNWTLAGGAAGTVGGVGVIYCKSDPVELSTWPAVPIKLNLSTITVGLICSTIKRLAPPSNIMAALPLNTPPLLN